MKKPREIIEKTIWQFTVMKYVAYFAVGIIPLVFGMGHWFPFSAPKALLIYLVTFAMLGLFGWGIFSKNNDSLSFRITPVHGALGVFLTVLTIGALLGIDPHNSFFGVWSQSISVMLIFTVSIFACLMGFLVKRDNDFTVRLFTISFISSVIFSIITYFGDRAIPLSRWGGTLGNTSFAGAYLVFTICFGIGLLFWYKKPWQKVVTVIGLLVTFFSPIFFNHDLFTGTLSLGQVFKNPVLFMGQANGAIIGVVVAILVMISLYLIRNNKKWVQIIGVICFIGILGGIFTTGIMLRSPDSVLHKAFIEQKTGNRFLFWDIARDGFVEKPLLGNGFNNYSYTFQDHFRPEFYQEGFAVESWTNQPHNMFWEYMSTTGILGTISFFVVLVVIFIGLYFRSKADIYDDRHGILRIVLLGSLVGYFVQNLFGFDVPITYLFLLLIAGVAIGLSEKQWLVTMSNVYRNNQVFSITMITVSIFGTIFLGILPWRESLQWRNATNKNNITSTFSNLESLQKMSWLGGVADSAFLIDTFFDKYQKEVIESVQKTKSTESLANIEKFLEQELSKQPDNFRAHITVAKIMTIHMFLDKKTQEVLWDRAYDHIVKAQQLNSQNPDTYFTGAQLYVVKNDFKNARAYVRAGITIAPEYGRGAVIMRDINKLESVIK